MCKPGSCLTRKLPGLFVYALYGRPEHSEIIQPVRQLSKACFLQWYVYAFFVFWFAHFTF